MPYQISFLRTLVHTAMGATLLVACSSQPIRFNPPLYPPPPAEARFIYDATLRSENDIHVATRRERLLDALSGGDTQPMGFAKPYGIAVKQQRVFVTDTQQRAVVMFDIPNKRFKLFGTEGPGSLQKPLGIAISKAREVYVVDATAKRVMVYDWDGKFVRSLGDKFALHRPAGIALDPEGQRCYVIDVGGVDSDAHRIVVLDSHSGAVLTHIGKRGNGEGEFNLPLQISIDHDGRLYVVDSGNFRIQVFDATGKFLRAFGSAGRFGGQFSRPKGIAIDDANNVYVIDTAFGNFQIFDAQGQLLLHIGERGTGGGPGQFMLPAGIDIDDDGRIYVVDQFFRKIEIIRPVSLPALVLRP
ncbi:MAG: 6-bladed beta-propeller [Pseudomonadota bacterium]